MMKSKIAKVVAVFAVLLAVGIALLMLGPQNDAVSIESARKAGVLTAEEVAVAFEKVSAKLIERPVIESQHVKKGDILMQLDPTDTRLAIASVKAQLDQNTASIEKAKSELAVTKKQYHRAATLRKTGAGSESNVDETLNAYQAAKASLKELQANRVALEVELETLAVEEQHLTLRASEDGKVLSCSTSPVKWFLPVPQPLFLKPIVAITTFMSVKLKSIAIRKARKLLAMPLLSIKTSQAKSESQPQPPLLPIYG